MVRGGMVRPHLWLGDQLASVHTSVPAAAAALRLMRRYHLQGIWRGFHQLLPFLQVPSAWFTSASYQLALCTDSQIEATGRRGKKVSFQMKRDRDVFRALSLGLLE